MGINVSAIKAYVDEQRLPLIRKTVLGAETLKYISKQYGVKGETALNLLETTVEFADGSACGFADAGESTLSQRKLTPVLVKVNKSFCDKALAKYWMNKEVQIAAGESKLPLEEDFILGVVEGTQAGVENLIWAEDTVIGSAHAKGFLGLKSEMTQAVKGDTIYASTKAVYKAIPAEAIKDSVIFMGQDSFRDLVLELTEKNLYHSNPVQDESWEIILPGTVTKVVGVPGLNGKNAIVSLQVNHAFYGTDMEGDEEKFDFWYSQDNQDYRMAIDFTASVQVAYPLENVYCNLGV